LADCKNGCLSASAEVIRFEGCTFSIFDSRSMRGRDFYSFALFSWLPIPFLFHAGFRYHTRRIVDCAAAAPASIFDKTFPS
jgi:hypothetical protein